MTMKQLSIITLSLLALLQTVSAQTSASIEKIWLEHNVTENGETGLRVHSKINLVDVLNHKMDIIAYFDSPAGTGILDNNGRYRAANGVVATSTSVNNVNAYGYFDDLVQFIPYSELQQEYDNPNMACHIFVHDYTVGSVLAQSEFVSFSLTTGRQAPSYQQPPSPTVANGNQSGGQGRVEKRQSAFGGEEIWYINTDGSAVVISHNPCVSCHGNKVCPICFGSGGRYANGMWYGCTYCAGLNGNCKACHGKGYTTLTSFINKYGNAIGYGEYGGVYLGSAAPNNYGQEDRREERRYDQNNKPIDIIKYNVPNYTGDPELMWCPKCDKWCTPHTHQTIR